MDPFSRLDLVALAWFIGTWIVYAITVEWSRYGRGGLNHAMDRYRETWMPPHARTRDADGRHADHGGAAERHGLLCLDLAARGRWRAGVVPLHRRHAKVLAILPLGIETSRILWEVKVVGLAVILVYAFFKFAWSYRLYNYVAILLGAMPFASEKDTPEAEAHVCAPRSCSRRRAGTSTAASARSSSRSPISAGSLVRGC